MMHINSQFRTRLNTLNTINILHLLLLFFKSDACNINQTVNKSWIIYCIIIVILWVV